MQFEPMNYILNLRYMGVGLAGIFPERRSRTPCACTILPTCTVPCATG